MSRKPKSPFSPRPRKLPHVAPQNLPESIIDEKPRWRTSFIDYEGPWGFNRVSDAESLKLILGRLKNFETMTWAQIEGDENHAISISRLCKDARNRLRELKKDDYQDLFSFRLTGKKRFWGIRQLDACYLLWWDPDHTVCPSLKKHT